MGTEAIWIPLAMSALAGGASYYNTRQTEKKQDNALAGQLRTQAAHQHDADARTAQLVQQQQQSTPDAAKASTLAQFQQQLLANKGNSTRTLEAPGAVSAAYQKSGSDAALGMGQYGNAFADLVANIDAPGQQRAGEQRNMNRYASDLDLIKRNSGGDDFLAQLKMRNIKRNPWIDAASSVAQGYAGSYGGGASPIGGAGAPAAADAGWWNAYGTGGGTKPGWAG